MSEAEHLVVQLSNKCRTFCSSFHISEQQAELLDAGSVPPNPLCRLKGDAGVTAADVAAASRGSRRPPASPRVQGHGASLKNHGSLT